MNKLFPAIIKEAIRRKCKSSESFDEIKKEICGRFKAATPRNADIRDYCEQSLALENFSDLIGQRKKAKLLMLKKIIKSKRVRTLSGVAVVAVLTKSHPCRGKCLYCPTEKGMPKSYLSNEPAVMRAISVKFDPYKQVQKRLRALEINGHEIGKIELIVMGGTFSDLPKKYQHNFVTECFRAANDYPQVIKGTESPFRDLVSKLIFEQARNEKARHRIIGLTLETRPDTLDEKEVGFYRKLGATRVEIGIQSIFDDVLKKNRRGHDVAQTIKATRLLKDSGFKISYHMMPGLFGSSPKKDLKMFREIFTNPDFQPDLVKIYPCVVTRNSALNNLWKNKKYRALTNTQTEKLIREIKKIVPPYVRISRLIRDIPMTSIVAGPNISNLRQIIRNKGVRCNCIRCREVRGSFTNKEKMTMRRIDYDASNGKEIYLEYVSPNFKKLYSMLRLRVTTSLFLPLLSKERAGMRSIALVREIHTYGKLISLGDKNKKSPQHAGLGKKLIAEAERIARREFGCQKISVISGVGAREYYRKLGYRLHETYMIKKL